MPRPKKSSYGNEKPPLSYVALCAMAIRNSTSGMMSLNEIYRYIINTFPYYKSTSSKWRNSLRHNLSFNDCFVKIVQGSENGNKRSLWSLHPNCGDMFEDGSLLRRKRRFTTKKRRQKEDGSFLQVRDAATSVDSKLIGDLRQHEDTYGKSTRQRSVLERQNLEQKASETNISKHSNLFFIDTEKKAKLTNFSIENILRESFSTEQGETTPKRKVIHPESLLISRTDPFDLMKCLGRDRTCQDCTCSKLVTTASPYQHCFEMPFCCHDYSSYPCHVRNRSCSQSFVKPNRETFTLHYKACWP